MDGLEIDDDIYINKNLSITGLITPADLQRRKQSSPRTTVCLAVVCAVLLAGNIGQIIYYEFLSHHVSTDGSQSDYNTQPREKDNGHNGSTTAERDHRQSTEPKQLEASLSNVTEEKLELQRGYDALATERDQFEARFINMSNKRDQLQASYNALKQESEGMQTSYDGLRRTLQELQTKHSNLTASSEQLQTKCSHLQRDNDALQTRLRTLTADRDQARSNYSSLQMEKEKLQRNYKVISASKDQMQRSYRSLWKDKEQLQTQYKALLQEKAWLDSNYSSLVAGRDHLQRRLSKATAKLKGIRCQTGWTQFDISCYFVSNTTQNWTDSREACQAAGADLVVIDDADEQQYVNGLLRLDQNAWIGLTDRLTEGTWRWVDGSPVTTTFWLPEQPNNFRGNQDCAETVHGSGPGATEGWNDDGCFAEQTWICEQ